MQDLVQRGRLWMRKYGIGARPDAAKTGITVGVSGGADSVCLLVLLFELAEEFALDLAAVHVHHGIRGKEADRDEAFVKKICGQFGIPFIAEHANVPETAKEEHITLEEAGRKIRYDRFEKQRKLQNAEWIAVAHHREDQAETVLMNLFRGSGIQGMGGIRPVQGRILRPLLDWSRGEIEQFLNEREISWCEDSTNRETDAVRNRLRLELLPEILKTWPEAVTALCRSAEQFAETGDYIKKEAGKRLDAYMEAEEDGFSLPAEKLRTLPAALRKEVLYQALGRAAGGKKDLTAKHIAILEGLCGQQSGRRVSMPGQITVSVRYGRIVFKTGERQPSGEAFAAHEMKVIPRSEAEKIKENDCTKQFDYDRMEQIPVWRFRMPEDRIAVYADGREKKLQDVFTDRKIPADKRDGILLLAAGSEILWAVGVRRSEKYRVTKETKQVLHVTVKKEAALQENSEKI